MKRDPSLLGECLELQPALARYPTLVQLKRSAEWSALEPRFARLFGTPRVSLPLNPPRPSPDPSRLLAVQWNIEHGNEFERIESALLDHSEIAGADLLLFNEIDLGCARAGNRDVTADLARALGFNAVFAPLYLETTVGRDDDARSAAGGENQEGLFGNAILSRYPLGEIRIVPLPSPIEIQFDLERMFGRHAALIVEIMRPGAPFVAVSAHLEVHRTREHRAAQVRAIVAALREERRPIVLAGDFNTHTFDRGLWHAPIAGAAALLVTPGALLERRLRWPDRGRSREGLFDELRDAGFEWDRFIDREPTLQLRFERLDEFHALPPPMLKAAKLALRWAERRARLRLDWFAGRGWRDGRGHTARGLDGPGLASDHAPIVAEFV